MAKIDHLRDRRKREMDIQMDAQENGQKNKKEKEKRQNRFFANFAIEFWCVPDNGQARYRPIFYVGFYAPNDTKTSRKFSLYIFMLLRVVVSTFGDPFSSASVGLSSVIYACVVAMADVDEWCAKTHFLLLREFIAKFCVFVGDKIMSLNIDCFFLRHKGMK